MAKKKVLISHGEDNVQEVNLQGSDREGQRYHLPKGSEGLHFPNLEGVEGYFKRRFPDAEIEIK